MSSFRTLVAQVAALPLDSTGAEALARFESDPKLNLLPVMQPDGSIAGLLRRSAFLNALAQGFGREIYLRRPIGLLVQPALVVVESCLSIDAVAWATSEADSEIVAPGAIVMEDGRYFGVVESGIVYRALTRSLDEKAYKLNVALAEAELARDAKSNFLAAMSHEIRTPLNGILGMTQALAATGLNTQQANLLSVVSESGEVLLRLLDDVLDMSKIDSGKLQLDVSAVDVSNVLQTAAALFAERARDKGLGFHVDFEQVCPGWFETDSARLKQIIYNIVANAVKFTETGAVTITAAISTIEAESLALTISVADTGIGMSEDTLSRLFRPFEQADLSTTRRFGGSGLGLSICGSLIAMMGGSIKVESTIDEGSCFTVFIPMRSAAVPSIIEAASRFHDYEPKARQPLEGARIELETSPTDSTAGYADDADGETLKILAAEDNPTNRKVLDTLLAPLGVDLCFAENGAIAFEIFQQQRFDVVLMDLQMPVMGGLDCARAIRVFEQTNNQASTPILALSANAMRHHVEEALAAGMDGHVAKPISLPALIHAIEVALGAAVAQSDEQVAA